MIDRTDSELRSAWERVEAEQSTKAIGHVRRRELEAQREQIVFEWREILNKKRAGVLTDRSRVDLTITTAKQLALVHGIRLDLDEIEGTKDDEYLATFWFVRATAAVGAENPSAKRWAKFGTAVAAELIASGFTIMPDDATYWMEAAEATADEWRNQPENFRLLLANEGPPVHIVGVAWRVNTWVWEGPNLSGLQRHIPNFDRPRSWVE